MGDPVKEEMGITYVVDGLGELGRGLELKEVLNPVRAPKAQQASQVACPCTRVGSASGGYGWGMGGRLRVRWCGKLIGGTWAAGMCGGREGF